MRDIDRVRNLCRDLRASDNARVAAVAVAWVLVCLLALALGGCSSAAPPCPPVVPPEVVEVPVYHPPAALPTPRPPELLIYGVDETDPTAVLSAIAHDWHELLRAWLEARAIIDAANEAREPGVE